MAPCGRSAESANHIITKIHSRNVDHLPSILFIDWVLLSPLIRPAFAKSCYEHGPLGGAVGAGKRAEGMGSPPILCCYLVGRENTLGCTHWGQCKKKKNSIFTLLTKVEE